MLLYLLLGRNSDVYEEAMVGREEGRREGRGGEERSRRREGERERGLRVMEREGLGGKRGRRRWGGRRRRSYFLQVKVAAEI